MLAVTMNMYLVMCHTQNDKINYFYRPLCFRLLADEGKRFRNEQFVNVDVLLSSSIYHCTIFSPKFKVGSTRKVLCVLNKELRWRLRSKELLLFVKNTWNRFFFTFQPTVVRVSFAFNFSAWRNINKIYFPPKGERNRKEMNEEITTFFIELNQMMFTMNKFWRWQSRETFSLIPNPLNCKSLGNVEIWREASLDDN